MKTEYSISIFLILLSFYPLLAQADEAKAKDIVNQLFDMALDSGTPSFTPSFVYKEFTILFPGKINESNIVLETQSVSLNKYKDGPEVQPQTEKVILSFSDKYFHISPEAIDQKDQYSISISSDAVHSCSATCISERFPKYSELIIEESAYEISFIGGNEFVKWCWKNKLPILQQKDRYYWKYEGKPLPKLDNDSQFVSIEEYEKRLNKACSNHYFP